MEQTSERDHTSRVTNSECLFYNALALETGLNYTLLKKLKEQHASWENAWHAHTKRTSPSHDPDKAWRKLEDKEIHLVLFGETGYPALLKEIAWAPFGLYYKGRLPDVATPTIALVGTRKVTEAGKALAHTFGSVLGARGVVVISGLALGADAASHAGCLEGGGTTLAVLANGLHAIYPRQHEHLGQTILERGGALVSEYPLEVPSLPRHFIERNRIVSGLSQAVVVIEAPERSGSLATARFALEQNRHVAVVPGPPTHPNYRGSHKLVREGATLTTTPDELLEDIGYAPAEESEHSARFANEEEEHIYELIRVHGKPLQVDKIVEASELETQVVTKTLTLLILKNAIKESGDGYEAANARHR